MIKKDKFHTIHRPGQEHDIDELFEEVFAQINQLLVTNSKGDMIVYDGSRFVRFPRGEDGQVLTSRSTASAGLTWEDREDGGDGSTGAGAMRYWFNGLPYGAL